jgi:hypothetical protein
MEFVDGLTLREWLDASPRSWREILDVMSAAGRGLSAAHAAGLLHRDFKPENVMLGRDGRVRVMDFGLATAHREEPKAEVGEAIAATALHDLGPLAMRLTRVGSVMGTPGYMSPEQFQGEGVDARSDQFAFGVTLWEALDGKRPFVGNSFLELATSVMGGRRQPLTRRGLPTWIRLLLLRSTESAPEKRFPDLDALLREIDRGQQRSRGRVLTVVAAGLALTMAGAVGWHRYDEASRVAACHASAAEIEQTWNDERREEVCSRREFRLRQQLPNRLCRGSTSTSSRGATLASRTAWTQRSGRHWTPPRSNARTGASTNDAWKRKPW